MHIKFYNKLTVLSYEIRIKVLLNQYYISITLTKINLVLI